MSRRERVIDTTESVGTGRRARLRILCSLRTCGFKSHLPHQKISLNDGSQEWRNWQTRRLQVPVVARSCGFKSHFLHSFLFIQNQKNRSAQHRHFCFLFIFVTVQYPHSYLLNSYYFSFSEKISLPPQRSTPANMKRSETLNTTFLSFGFSTFRLT